MHRTSIREANAVMPQDGYAKQFMGLFRLPIWGALKRGISFLYGAGTN